MELGEDEDGSVEDAFGELGSIDAVSDEGGERHRSFSRRAGEHLYDLRSIEAVPGSAQEEEGRERREDEELTHRAGARTRSSILFQ